MIIAENKDDIGAAGCLRNREASEHHPAEQGHPGRGSRSRARSTAWMTLLCGMMLTCLPISQAASRPNIVFIFSDDHAVQAIGAYGSKVNRTPHIDRLAHEPNDRCVGCG